MPISRRQWIAASLCASQSRLLGSSSDGVDPASKDLTQRQLFLDDTWIEHAHRLERTWEPAMQRPEPVLRPEAPWESNQIVLSGSVFRLGREWRMYYRVYNPPTPPLCCMAVSNDGLRWERPKLGLFSFQGSKANNIIFAHGKQGESNDGLTFCHDPQDTKRPFKLMYYAHGGTLQSGEYVGFSQDGINWTHNPEPVLTNTGDRTFLLDGRDHREKYVAYLRHTGMRKRFRARTIWQSESDDFLKWTEPKPVLEPDLLDDPNAELYGMPVFRYSDLYLGMLEQWYGDPDKIEVQLAWSHNGTDWMRPEKRSSFIGAAFPWNQRWNSVANTPPIEMGNQLWFYYGGRSAAHWAELPQSYGAIGLATTYIDRFAAIQAGFREGELLTKPMVWPGGELALCCTPARNTKGHAGDGGGAISVELRAEDNTGIPGYSGTASAFHNVVSPERWSNRMPIVRWPGAPGMDALKGKRIRLAFLLRDARLYSFHSRPTGD